ncbi:MAG: outer membrane beta-barrel protein [Burkholderiales bacterium]|jgi:hypothetical protein
MTPIFRTFRMFRPVAGLALVAALAAAPAAHAQMQQSKAPGALDGYVGLTYGAAAGLLDGFDTCSNGVGCTNKGSGAAGVFAGLRVWTVPVFGGLPLYGEVGWQDFAKVTQTYYGKPVSTGNFDAITSGRSLYAAAKLEVPVSQTFSLYTRLGLANTTVDVAGGTGAGTRLAGRGGTGNELLFGLGLQYRFLPNWSLRADMTSFGTVRGTGAAAANLGIAYHF